MSMSLNMVQSGKVQTASVTASRRSVRLVRPRSTRRWQPDRKPLVSGPVARGRQRKDQILASCFTGVLEAGGGGVRDGHQEDAKVGHQPGVATHVEAAQDPGRTRVRLPPSPHALCGNSRDGRLKLPSWARSSTDRTLDLHSGGCWFETSRVH